MWVLIVYWSKQSVDLPHGFADYLVQRVKRCLIAAVRVSN
jgi:hypothetical protein